MSNFYLENKDIQFYMNHLNLDEIIPLIENNFEDNKSFDYAPRNISEAKEDELNLTLPLKPAALTGSVEELQERLQAVGPGSTCVIIW